MKSFKPANIIHKPTFQFSYLGIFGIIIFLLLRTTFDFNAGARINQSSKSAVDILHNVNSQLGFNSDSLNGIATRYQDGTLYRLIRDESRNNIKPYQLNRSSVPVNGWSVVIGGTYTEPNFIQGSEHLFNRLGYSRGRISGTGLLVEYENSPSRNHTFVEGEASQIKLKLIMKAVFGYDISHYRASESSSPVSTQTTSQNSIYSYADSDGGRLHLEKISPSAPGPLSLVISYSNIDRNGLAGFSIDSFNVFYTSVDTEDNGEPFILWSTTLLILMLALITIVILGTAIRQIFRGRMEWKRSLLIFGGVFFAQFIWQISYLFPTYYSFFPGEIIVVDLLQQLLLASFYGIYASFAYVAWESLARELKSGQIPVIDAVWGGQLMKKEVGAGILTGYGIAGIYFVIIALMFYSYEIVMFQNDSTLMRFREPTGAFPALGVFLNAWLSSMLFVIAQVGVAYNLIAFAVSREKLRMVLCMAVAGFSLFAIGPVFGSDGSTLQVLSIYLALSIPLVMAYRYFGIVSAIISWFVLLMGIRMLPYIGSESTFIASQAWILIIILLTPFLFGLFSVFYGKNMESVKKYIPEYEEKLNKRLRSEKELAIAKESQAALMPDTPPSVEGLDIHGFFVPSHEVGGDFYDFTLIRDEYGKNKALAFAIVDVSGKAMQSAFNAIFTSGLLLSRINSDTPGDVLTGINPILCDKTDDQTFITCQVGQIRLHDKTLLLSNAGHCPPVLKRNGTSSFIPLASPRFPLGFKKNIIYNSSEIPLESGDILFFYSDGLPEAQHPDGKRLDFEQIRSYLNTLETTGRPAAEISLAIKRYILEFSNYELADDTTLLCIKVT